MSAESTEPGRLAALSRRAGLTEGQTYTVVLLLVVGALLTSSLTGLTGRLAGVAAPPPVPVESSAPAPSSSIPVSTTVPTAPPVSTASSRPTSPPAPTTTRAPGFAPAAPFEPLEPDEPPESQPCPSDALIGATRDTLTTVDALIGGALPDATVVSALALATGCSNTDPGILLLAALIEVGQGIPDLGLGIIELPVLPFLLIPGPVIDAVQPLRDALDPICGTVSTLSVLTSQAGPAYPPPFDAAFSVSLFYALATCGQIQAPS